MAHGFGHLYKLQSIIYYRLSPFEQKALKGIISHGFPNTIRRTAEQIPYIVPPLALCYLVYDLVEKRHDQLMRKNPADFENEK